MELKTRQANHSTVSPLATSNSLGPLSTTTLEPLLQRITLHPLSHIVASDILLPSPYDRTVTSPRLGLAHTSSSTPSATVVACISYSCR